MEENGKRRGEEILELLGCEGGGRRDRRGGAAAEVSRDGDGANDLIRLLLRDVIGTRHVKLVLVS